MAKPSNRQIEKHIRLSAQESANVAITAHARARMRLRQVNEPMVFEVLRRGNLALRPEPDPKQPGLLCRMRRFVAGVTVAVVSYLEYPEPDLTVVTVIDIKKD